MSAETLDFNSGFRHFKFPRATMNKFLLLFCGLVMLLDHLIELENRPYSEATKAIKELASNCDQNEDSLEKISQCFKLRGTELIVLKLALIFMYWLT